MSSFLWPSPGVFISEYPTFGDFPATALNGALAIALDTNNLYSFNEDMSAWVLIASPGGEEITFATFGSTPIAAGASVSGTVVTLQPADGTHAGGISLLDQVMGAGKKSFIDATANDSVLFVDATFSLELLSAVSITATAAGLTNNTALSLLYESQPLDPNGIGVGLKVTMDGRGADIDATMIGMYVGLNSRSTNTVTLGYVAGPRVVPLYSLGFNDASLSAAWSYDALAMTFTDILTGTNTILQAEDDEVYVGSANQFSAISFVLSTPASSSVEAKYFYWDGGFWIQLSPDDETGSFTRSGQVLIVGQTTGWTQTTVNTVNAFYIRIIRNATTVATSPVESAISAIASSGVSYWGPVGDLHISSMEASSTITGDQLISTINPGTPPLVVASTDLVENLYAAKADDVTFIGTRAYEISSIPATVGLITYNNISYGSGYNTSTGAYTAPSDGYYTVMARIGANNVGAGEFISVQIVLNGIKYSEDARFGPVSTSPCYVDVKDTLPCDAGGTISIFGYTTAVSPVPLTGSTICVVTIQKVGV